MIESCCGLLCSECEYRESMNCATCFNVDEQFWGKCPIKSCVLEKGLKNCGFCGDFSCDLLKKFSYDKEQGDDGQRIEQCRKWADT